MDRPRSRLARDGASIYLRTAVLLLAASLLALPGIALGAVSCNATGSQTSFIGAEITARSGPNSSGQYRYELNVIECKNGTVQYSSAIGFPAHWDWGWYHPDQLVASLGTQFGLSTHRIFRTKCGHRFVAVGQRYTASIDSVSLTLQAYPLKNSTYPDAAFAPLIEPLNSTVTGCEVSLNAEKNTDQPNACSNPINFATGNKFERAVDFESAQPFPLRVERLYQSKLGAGSWELAMTPAILPLTDYITRSRLPAGCGGLRFHASGGCVPARLHELQPDYISATSSLNVIRAFIVFRPDGRVLKFQGAGAVADPDVADRLTVIPAGATNLASVTGYRYRRLDGTVEDYDTSGRPVAITDRNGISHQYSYGTNQTVITHSLGGQLVIDYNGRDAARVTTPEGAITYSYAQAGILDTVTYADGSTERYQYDASRNRLLTARVDKHGHLFARWEYDSTGRGRLSEHAGGADRVSFDYSQRNSATDPRVTATSPLGKQAIYHLTTQHGVHKVTGTDGLASANCPAGNRATTWDVNGFAAGETDWKGNTTLYTRDALGRELSRTEAAGTPEERTVTTTWFGEIALPLEIVEPLRVVNFTYDTQGRTLTHTVASPDRSESQTWHYTYHANGLLATVDGPRTDVADITTHDYDGNGNLVIVTNALGHQTRYLDYTGAGRPGRSIDPNGVETTYGYHPRGWLESATVHTAEGPLTTQIAYDASGEVTGITLPDGSFMGYEYDAAHRLVAMVDSLGQRLEFALDAAGNRVGEQILDADHQLVYTHTRVFDELAHLLQDQGANGQQLAYTHDLNGNATDTVDALGNGDSRTFDALDRLRSVTDSYLNDAAMDYDAGDRVSVVTDQRGLQTRYTYDYRGLPLEVDSPDSGLTTHRYDEAGNRVETVDGRGITTTYRYDALNRLVEASYPANPAENIVYGYDDTANDNFGIGRLTSVTGDRVAIHWRYDERGLPTAITQDIDGLALTTRHAYDAAGRPVHLDYPSGRKVYLERDANGQVTAVDTTSTDTATTRPVA